jgi:predicted dehydrogenase
VDGSVHLDRAMPFLKKGIPMFVDKPFTCSLAHAKTLVEFATERHLPLMSSSSLRYAPEVVKAKTAAADAGKIMGATTYGPAPLDPKGRNPGLFHYGIHPVEMLFTLMGLGCERVTAIGNADGEVVAGQWSGGRVGSVRGLRKGAAPYGFTVFGEKAVTTQSVSTQFIYRELLKQIVSMFTTKEMPIDLRETLEIVAFIEAAKTSLEQGGTPMKIQV